MINLLPEQTKKDIVAARMNVLLLRYTYVSIGLLIMVLVLCIGLFFIMQESQAQAKETADRNRVKTAQYHKVSQEATEYAQNLNTAHQIINNSISYSKLAMTITSLIPKGVILDNLNLDPNTINQQTTFSAKAKTYEDALALQESFQSAPSVFSNVSLQNVTQSKGGEDPYGVSVAISLKINPEALK